MRVLGARVYLNMPELPESKLELSPELKRELKEDMAQRFDRLTVFAVGEGVNKDTSLQVSINVGDQVFVDPIALKRAPLVKIDGKEKISVNFYDIMHIWE